MDARRTRAVSLRANLAFSLMAARACFAMCVVFLGVMTASAVHAAGYRTRNFIISAASPEFAKTVGDEAERLRRDLAIEWLGSELPPWQDPCPIRVNAGNLGAGGVTSFMFDNGRPFGWEMEIQGSHERILDSVLPHEITHTIFATHFGRPLPRWADEGACTTVEHETERRKQHHMLNEFLTTGRGIAFNQMFAMREYPPDILPLYSQGYSLARFLIHHGGKRKFVAYVGEGMKRNNWTAATERHYGYASLSELQVTWLEWVRRGSRTFDSRETLLVQLGLQPESDRAPIALASAALPNQVAPDQTALNDANANRSEWNGAGLIGDALNGTASSGTLPNDVPSSATAVEAPSTVANSKRSWYARVRDGETSAPSREAAFDARADALVARGKTLDAVAVRELPPAPQPIYTPQTPDDNLVFPDGADRSHRLAAIPASAHPNGAPLRTLMPAGRTVPSRGTLLR